MSNEIREDRAGLAAAIAEGVEFIAIVEASAGAIADPAMRKRLLLLGGITGGSDEEKLAMVDQQIRRKSELWEFPHKIFKLVPVPRK